MVLLVFSMAAPLLVNGAGEDDDKKQWASVQKLLGSQNYILWYSGLSVSLMALTAQRRGNAAMPHVRAACVRRMCVPHVRAACACHMCEPHARAGSEVAVRVYLRGAELFAVTF